MGANAAPVKVARAGDYSSAAAHHLVRVRVGVRVRISAPLGDERKLEAVHRRVLVDGDAPGAARERHESEARC